MIRFLKGLGYFFISRQDNMYLNLIPPVAANFKVSTDGLNWQATLLSFTCSVLYLAWKLSDYNMLPDGRNNFGQAQQNRGANGRFIAIN